MNAQFASFTDDETPAVEKIVERAHELFAQINRPRDRLDIRMDLAAVHAHTPLRLQDLAEADNFTFNHDLAGIYRHLNRETGKLDNHFLPRTAKPGS